MARIIFILVEPSFSGNIGSAARALKTMGFDELRLVNPCDFNNDEARRLAYASQEILENAKVYPSLHEAVADIDFVIGTSAKHRRVRYDYHPAADVPKIIYSKGNLVNQCAIVFGREENGLYNDELNLCNIISYIPMSHGYPSLNLSQSVMIYAYEVFKQALPDKKEIEKDAESCKKIIEKTSSILTSMRINENRILFNRILERTSLLSKDDLNLLHAIYKYF